MDEIFKGAGITTMVVIILKIVFDFVNKRNGNSAPTVYDVKEVAKIMTGVGNTLIDIKHEVRGLMKINSDASLKLETIKNGILDLKEVDKEFSGKVDKLNLNMELSMERQKKTADDVAQIKDKTK